MTQDAGPSLPVHKAARVIPPLYREKNPHCGIPVLVWVLIQLTPSAALASLQKTPVHKLLGRGNARVVALDLNLSLRAHPPQLWTLAARQCAAFFVTVVTLSGGGSNCFSIPVDFRSPRVLVPLAGSGRKLVVPRRSLKRRLRPWSVRRQTRGFFCPRQPACIIFCRPAGTFEA